MAFKRDFKGEFFCFSFLDIAFIKLSTALPDITRIMFSIIAHSIIRLKVCGRTLLAAGDLDGLFYIKWRRRRERRDYGDGHFCDNCYKSAHIVIN